MQKMFIVVSIVTSFVVGMILTVVMLSGAVKHAAHMERVACDFDVSQARLLRDTCELDLKTEKELSGIRDLTVQTCTEGLEICMKVIEKK